MTVEDVVHGGVQLQVACALAGRRLKLAPDGKLIAIDADSKVRYERIKLRKSSTDSVSYEKFLEDERKEQGHAESNKANLSACIAQADKVFINNGIVDDLYHKIDDFFALS